MLVSVEVCHLSWIPYAGECRGVAFSMDTTCW